MEKNDYIEVGEEEVVVDCWLPNSYTCCSFYIPKNIRKPITARLDFITSLEELESEYVRNHTKIDNETADQLMAEFKKLFAEIEEAVKTAGYRLVYSHSMNDSFCGGWWDVLFNLEER